LHLSQSNISGSRMAFLLQALLMSILLHLHSVSGYGGYGEPSRDCGCGSGKSPANYGLADEDRIVNGTKTNIEDIPYQAYIKFLYRDKRGNVWPSSCGGTLINKKYVLSAAHCFEDAFALQITFGVQNKYRPGPGASKTYQAKTVTIHPHYEDNMCGELDVALVELTEEVEFSSTIQPACLPSSSSNTYYDQDAIVSGYGAIYSGGPPSVDLMSTKLKIVHENDEVCQNNVETFRCLYKIDDSMLCAYADGTDACQGDSGGPLIASENGRNTVVGVVSFGHKCAAPNHAGVYAKVTYVLDWINGIVEDGWCN